MKKTKAEIIARMNQVGHTTRFCNGSCPTKRAKEIGEIDEESRKVPFIAISSNNAGERYDWWEDEIYIEELDLAGAKTDRLETFFKDHRLSVDSAIGRIENIQKTDSELRVDVVFGRDTESDEIFQKYRDGILSDVSIGYIINDIVVTEKKDEPTHILVTDYEVVELSAVWRGFDAGAGRSASISKPKKDKTRDPKILLQKLKLKEIEK